MTIAWDNNKYLYSAQYITQSAWGDSSIKNKKGNTISF